MNKLNSMISMNLTDKSRGKALKMILSMIVQLRMGRYIKLIKGQFKI